MERNLEAERKRELALLRDKYEKDIRILERTHQEALKKQRHQYELIIKRLQETIEKLKTLAHRIPWMEMGTIVEENFTLEDFRAEIPGIMKFIVREIIKEAQYDCVDEENLVFVYLNNNGQPTRDSLAIDLYAALYDSIISAGEGYVAELLDEVKAYEVTIPRSARHPKFADMKLFLEVLTHRYRKGLRTLDIFRSYSESPALFAKELLKVLSTKEKPKKKTLKKKKVLVEEAKEETPNGKSEEAKKSEEPEEPTKSDPMVPVNGAAKNV